MNQSVKVKDMTPEQKREYNNIAARKHYLKKKDEIIERNKKYYHEHKETMLPKVREYYWDHRDEYCDYKKLRRELIKMAQE